MWWAIVAIICLVLVNCLNPKPLTPEQELVRVQLQSAKVGRDLKSGCACFMALPCLVLLGIIIFVLIAVFG